VQDAVANHQFRKGREPDGELDLPAVLATAAEIAAGMSYLHARGIVHGDLTGANILLASSSVRIYVRYLEDIFRKYTVCMLYLSRLLHALCLLQSYFVSTRI